MYEINTGETSTFDFSVDGKAYSVPTFESMPYKTLKDFREFTRGDVSGVDIAAWAVEHVFEAYAPGCTENLTVGQLYGLVDAYTKSQDELGE
jgi:hypothetical protein